MERDEDLFPEATPKGIKENQWGADDRPFKWSFKDIEEDMLTLGAIQDHEEGWAYVLKGDCLLFSEPYRFWVGANWMNPDPVRGHATSVEKEELASAVMSAGGDSMLFVHNHPSTLPGTDRDITGMAMMPSGGDAKSAKSVSEFFSDFGLKIRFFIASADGVSEFDTSGRVIRKSPGGKYYPSSEEDAAGIGELE